MKDASINNFGLLMAYLVPGFTTVLGLSYFSRTLQSWLAAAPSEAPTVGGFLYVTVGSVAAGLTVSAIRWALVDTLHHVTGLRQPKTWDFSRLQKNVEAIDLLIEIHYRYYQFYANMLVAMTLAYLPVRLDLAPWTNIGTDAAFLLLAVIFLAGSRDTLRKYYLRAGQILGSAPRAKS